MNPEDLGGKYGPGRLNRSAGTQDVTGETCWTGHPKWLLDSAIRSIGRYLRYQGGAVADLETGEIVWRPGDPGEPPRNPERGFYDKPHQPRRF